MAFSPAVDAPLEDGGQGSDSKYALWRFRIRQLGHLSVTNQMPGPGAGPMPISAGDENFSLAPVWIDNRSLFQLQHQVLAFHQKVTKGLAVFFLMKLSCVIQLHGGSRLLLQLRLLWQPPDQPSSPWLRPPLS